MTEEADEAEPETLLGRLEAVPFGSPGFDRAQLHLALSAALTGAGHHRLTLDESGNHSQAIPGVLAVVTVWGVAGSIATGLATPWFTWPLFGIAILFLVGLASDTRAGNIALATLLLGWVAGGVALLALEPHRAILTHGIPLALSVMIALARRSLRLADARDVALALTGFARSAPFVVPIVLIFLFLPALNADVWELAAALKGRNVIGAALLSVGALFLLVRLQLSREFEPVLSGRAVNLASDGTAPGATRELLAKQLKGDRARLVQELPDDPFEEAWASAGPHEYVPYLAATEGKLLRRPLTARLAITTVLTGALLSTYIYLLLAATVPRSVANRWVGDPIDTSGISLSLIHITMPTDEYLAVAGLLGVAATALFLAFTLTEERFAIAVTDALLRDPVDRLLLLALPYSILTEKVLTEAQAEAPGSGNGDDSDEIQASRSS